MLALLVAAQTLAVLELRSKLDGPAKKQVMQSVRTPNVWPATSAR